MQVQVPGSGLSDPGSDGWQSETFMGSNPVTAIESTELTIHLQQIDRFVQSLLMKETHQGFQIVVVKTSLRGLRTEAISTMSSP